MNFEVVEYDGNNEEKIEEIRNYRKWKTKYLDTVSKEYILREIEQQAGDNEEIKAFALLTYITSGRRNEVLNLRRDDFSTEHLNVKDENYEILLVRMMNQKNRNNDRKKIPMVKGLSPIEDRIIGIVEEWIENKDEYIFRQLDPTSWNKMLKKIKFEARYKEKDMPITENLIVKFGLYPHYLRHCRLTHLNWLSPVLITQLAGWSSSQLQGKFGGSKEIDTYIRRNWEPLAKEMILHGL